MQMQKTDHEVRQSPYGLSHILKDIEDKKYFEIFLKISLIKVRMTQRVKCTTECSGQWMIHESCLRMMNCLLMIMKLILLEFMTLSLPGASAGSDPVMSLPTTQTQMMTVPPSLHPSYFGTGYGYVMHLASFCISTALLVHLVEKLILIALLMLCCDAFLHSFMTILLHFILL